MLQGLKDIMLTFMSSSFLLMRKWSAPSTFRASSFFLTEVEMTVTSQPMALAAASDACEERVGWLKMQSGTATASRATLLSLQLA